jgi:AcrR family transcriptional regulator
MRKNASDVSLPGGSARFAKKRQLIVDAATQIINDKGVAGLTFAEVADFVGLSTSSATYYFPLKEQLAAAAFENTLNRIETLVADAAREPDPLSRVSKICTHVL